MEKTDRIR